MVSLVPNEDPSPGHSPPSPHQQRWTIQRSMTADVIYGPYTGDEEIEVVPAADFEAAAYARDHASSDAYERGFRAGQESPAAAADRLANAAEWYLTAWSDEGIAEARLELSRALSEYHSQKEQR